MSSTDYSEDAIVEQPAIALFKQLGYETANCFYEKVGASGSNLGRETTEGVGRGMIAEGLDEAMA